MSRGSDIALKVGQRLRQLRTERGLTQEKLAELSGVDYKHIQLMEGRSPTAARIDTIEKLAGAFGLSLAAFFDPEIFDGRLPESLSKPRKNSGE